MEFTAVPTDPAARIVQVLDSIQDAKRLQWNASQMRRAAGVFAMERTLEGLYTELDGLTAANPAAEHEARLIRARRNV
jgi:hypothetical protein